MQVYSSLSGIPFYAPSAGYAPTNSADVSAIASAYQVVSSTATQLYAGTAYVTSVNDAPISAARAGNAANASLANSAYYDGTGRLISALPDSAAVSAIASSYVESGVSSKQDTLSFAYNTADQISSINGSALGGMDEAAVSGIASAYAESAVSSKADSSALSSYVPYSSLEYNTASAISGINGSALAAGSTYTAGEGIDITDDVISVEAPVDIVAGPGIVIDNPDGNTLRVSVDQAIEVTLYEDSTGTDAPLLTENVFNFARVRVTYMGGALIKGEIERDISSTITTYNLTYPYFRPDSNNFVQFQCATMTVSNNGSTLTFTNGKRLWINPSSSSNGNDVQPIKCTKVVGIHRIAGGN